MTTKLGSTVSSGGGLGTYFKNSVSNTVISNFVEQLVNIFSAWAPYILLPCRMGDHTIPRKATHYQHSPHEEGSGAPTLIQNGAAKVGIGVISMEFLIDAGGIDGVSILWSVCGRGGGG